MEQERTTRYAIELVTKNCFFRYAVDYLKEHPKVAREWRIDDAMMQDFRRFLEKESFDYESAGEIEVDRLREFSDREGYESSTLAALDALEKRFEAEKLHDFDSNRDFIETRLEREILSQAHGERAMYESVLRRDPQTQAAVDLILDRDRYDSIVRRKEAIASVGSGTGG
jgi:carboxyl-terminal processing protease